MAINDSDQDIFEVQTFSFTERNSGSKLGAFKLRVKQSFIDLAELYEPLLGTTSITINYNTVDGTAEANSDYQSTSGSFTFNSINDLKKGKTIKVPILGDKIIEPDEKFFLELKTTIFGNNYNESLTGIIKNDDKPRLSINKIHITEGNSGTKKAAFVVKLSTDSTQTVKVKYSTANNTAKAGSDYISTSGTLTFSPGETKKTINVSVKGDKLVENNEQFYVNLKSPTNATIATSRGVGVIKNDDQIRSTGDLLFGNQTTLVGSTEFQEITETPQQQENWKEESLANIDYELRGSSNNIITQPERSPEIFPIAVGDVV